MEHLINFVGCQWYTQLVYDGPGRPNRIVVSFLFFNFSEEKKLYFLVFFS